MVKMALKRQQCAATALALIFVIGLFGFEVGKFSETNYSLIETRKRSFRIRLLF